MRQTAVANPTPLAHPSPLVTMSNPSGNTSQNAASRPSAPKRTKTPPSSSKLTETTAKKVGKGSPQLINKSTQAGGDHAAGNAKKMAVMQLASVKRNSSGSQRVLVW